MNIITANSFKTDNIYREICLKSFSCINRTLNKNNEFKALKTSSFI